jgi:hypothetical protein
LCLVIGHEACSGRDRIGHSVGSWRCRAPEPRRP